MSDIVKNTTEHHSLYEEEVKMYNHYSQSNGVNHKELIVADSGQSNVEDKPSQDDKGLQKLSGLYNFDNVFQNEYLLEELLEFLSFEEIFAKVYPLNSTYSKLVNEANYLLLRKLADKLNITSGYLTTNLPAKERIVDVYKQVMVTLTEDKEINFKPTAFYTDSGLIGTNMWYSFHNIFDANTSNMYGGYVFSSNDGYNNHIQCYLCVPGAGVDNAF
jgi:hypothetical protein